jgi:hypothetical protein
MTVKNQKRAGKLADATEVHWSCTGKSAWWFSFVDKAEREEWSNIPAF